MNKVVEMVILLCPVCATPQDAPESTEPKEFWCLTCEQRWTMHNVAPARFAEHALT